MAVGISCSQAKQQMGLEAHSLAFKPGESEGTAGIGARKYTSGEPEKLPTEQLLKSNNDKSDKSNKLPFWVAHEVPRKMFHLCHGVYTLWLYLRGFSTTQIFWPLLFLLIVIGANDWYRLRHPEVNARLVKQLWFVIRPLEVESFCGIFFFLLGLCAVFATAPKDIAVMSVLVLLWADTAASTFGRQFGKYTFQVARGKSFAGCVASFAAGCGACWLFYGVVVPRCSVSTADFLWRPQTSRLSLLLYSLVTGLAASFSEAVDVRGIDDNFTIPVFGSCLMAVLVWAFRLG